MNVASLALDHDLLVPKSHELLKCDTYLRESFRHEQNHVSKCLPDELLEVE